MMKLNWFSPLPPGRTDIAHYTMRVLPELAKLARVTLWTDQSEWDVPAEMGVEVRQFAASDCCWRELNYADATYFHIGNNRQFHKVIWEASRAHPGIVVLHDLALQHLFSGIYQEELHDREGYEEAMLRHHGQEGMRAAGECWGKYAIADQLCERYPLTGLAVENASGVVVHNPDGFGRKEFSSLPAVCLPLPYRSHSFRRASAPDREIRLIVFGYIGTNRRLLPFLEAWAALAERDRFRLDIYGQLWDEGQVRESVKRLHLHRQVEIHGFVSEKKLDEALSRAHLAINLRYPTMGEASGSQLRIWDHGLPSLVTGTGWYATLDEQAVCRIDPHNEQADIQRHLAAFAAAPADFAAIGAAGKACLEQVHAPASYARELLAFAERVGRCRHQSAVLQLAERVGSHIGLFADECQTRQIAGQLAPRLGDLAAEPVGSLPAGPAK